MSKTTVSLFLVMALTTMTILGREIQDITTIIPEVDEETIKQICIEFEPNPEASGYICINNSSPLYIQCHSPEKVWDIRECADGTVCIAPPLTWIETNPCGHDETSYSSYSSQIPESSNFISESSESSELLESSEPSESLEYFSSSSSEQSEIEQSSSSSEVVNVPDDMTEICQLFNSSLEASGFVCFGENSSEYLRCHLAEKVAFMMACPAGTSCRAPANRYTINNPCLWNPPHPLEAYKSLYEDAYPPAADADKLCQVFSVNGTFCAAQFGLDTADTTTIHCADGKVDQIKSCSQGQACTTTFFVKDDANKNTEDFTEAVCTDLMPCTPDDLFAGKPCIPEEETGPETCGNGVLDIGEECEIGYLGCGNNCKCKEGYVSAAPATWYCIKAPDNVLPRQNH